MLSSTYDFCGVHNLYQAKLASSILESKVKLPLWESVIVLCFVVRYFMSILVLQSSWWGKESWLLCLICLPGVSWWLSGSSSRCHWVVCSLWLWYFLIILIYYFWFVFLFSFFAFCFSFFIFRNSFFVFPYSILLFVFHFSFLTFKIRPGIIFWHWNWGKI